MSEEGLIEEPVPKGNIGVRHFQVFLQCLFYIITVGIRISASVILVDMLNTNDQEILNGPKIVFSIFMHCKDYSFLITLLFSGWFCKKFGFKWPMIGLMFLISLFSLFLPSITEAYGYYGVILCLTIQGLASGLAFSMPADFISKWIPFQERTFLGTTVYASSRLGEVLAIFLSTYLSTSKLTSSFIYVEFGYLAIVWVVLMVIFGANSPEEYSSKISENELNFILKNRDLVSTKDNVPIPWKKIFTSMPFWAIIVAQIGGTWLTFVLALLPMYFDMYFDISQKNVFPWLMLISWILSFVISGVAQFLINRGTTTIGQSRKIFNSLGTFIPAVLLILLIFIQNGYEYSGIIFWSFISVSTIGTTCGSLLNSNDISTTFSPIIYGFASWFGSIFFIIIFQCFFQHFISDWSILFFYSVILLVITNIFYLIYGSGEMQEWNLYDTDTDDAEFSKTSSYAACDEKKYLLYIRKK